MSKISPQSVLALTATAGPPVVNDICHTLGIDENISEQEASDAHQNETDQCQEKGVTVFDCNRDNIDVAVHFIGDEGQRLSMVR
jgi:superfamily II DNA helicase RecQ